MFKTLTKDEFKKYLENDEFILVDIRTDREREIYGQIQDKQINIDFYCPKIKTNILALVKSKKYLIYCWHGHRSLVLINFMKDNGFEFACDLEGGIDNWHN